VARLIKASGPGRLTDLVSMGVLTSLVPQVVLDEANDAHDCREVRVSASFLRTSWSIC
jgi:hypothetical protein